MSGIAQIITNRMANIICSNATINKIVCVADISGNIRCTCPLNPIRAQFTKIATRPIASMAFYQICKIELISFELNFIYNLYLICEHNFIDEFNTYKK